MPRFMIKLGKQEFYPYSEISFQTSFIWNAKPNEKI